MPITEITGNKLVSAVAASGDFLALAMTSTDGVDMCIYLYKTKQQMVYCDKKTNVQSNATRINPVVSMQLKRYANMNLLLAACQFERLNCYAINKRELVLIANAYDSSSVFDGKIGLASSVCMQGNYIMLLGKEKREVKVKLFKLKYIE